MQHHIESTRACCTGVSLADRLLQGLPHWPTAPAAAALYLAPRVRSNTSRPASLLQDTRRPQSLRQEEEDIALALAMSASEAEAVAAALAEPIDTEDARAIAVAQASCHQHSSFTAASDHVPAFMLSLGQSSFAAFAIAQKCECGHDNASMYYNTAMRPPALWYVRQGGPVHLVCPVTSSVMMPSFWRAAEAVCCCKLAGGAAGETAVSWLHGGPATRRRGFVSQGTSSQLTRRRAATHPERPRRAAAGTASRAAPRPRPPRARLHRQVIQQVREPSSRAVAPPSRICRSYEGTKRVACITAPPHCHFWRSPDLLRRQQAACKGTRLNQLS